MTLSEEVCDWGWVLRFQNPVPFPVSFLCLVLMDGSISS